MSEIRFALARVREVIKIVEREAKRLQHSKEYYEREYKRHEAEVARAIREAEQALKKTYPTEGKVLYTVEVNNLSRSGLVVSAYRGTLRLIEEGPILEYVRTGGIDRLTRETMIQVVNMLQRRRHFMFMGLFIQSDAQLHMSRDDGTRFLDLSYNGTDLQIGCVLITGIALAQFLRSIDAL
jgi:hypothetical protein